jgi:hypothetical protein
VQQSDHKYKIIIKLNYLGKEQTTATACNIRGYWIIRQIWIGSISNFQLTHAYHKYGLTSHTYLLHRLLLPATEWWGVVRETLNPTSNFSLWEVLVICYFTGRFAGSLSNALFSCVIKCHEFKALLLSHNDAYNHKITGILKQLKFQRLLQHVSVHVGTIIREWFLCLAKTTVMILYPRHSWRGQCHGSIPTCCAVHGGEAQKWLPDDGSYMSRNMLEQPSEFLIGLIFLWFYDCVHHCGTVKSALILLMHGTDRKNAISC